MVGVNDVPKDTVYWVDDHVKELVEADWVLVSGKIGWAQEGVNGLDRSGDALFKGVNKKGVNADIAFDIDEVWGGQGATPDIHDGCVRGVPYSLSE